MSNGYKTRLTGTAALSKRIRDLEAANASLRTAARVKNSTINGGKGLTVLDENGNQVAIIGHDTFGDRGVAFTTPAGVDMLDFFVQTGTGLSFMEINDLNGVPAFVTDAAGGGGGGIFWPWIPFHMAGMTIAQWPFNTSGTFTTVAQGGTNAFSQRIFVACRTICDSGATAGQVRLMVNGSQVGSTVAVTSSAGEADFGPSAAGVSINGAAFVEIQTRVTTGTGNCRAQPYQANWVNA